MPHAIFAIPGDPATATGGYIYDRRVMELLPRYGVEVHLCRLPGSYPSPTEADIAATRAALAKAIAAAGKDAVLIADGLAWGAYDPEAISDITVPVIELCHHPLGLEAGLPKKRAAMLKENESRMLALASHILVTSDTTAVTLVSDFGVAPGKVTVAVPGTDRAERASGLDASPLPLLAVGSIVPRKGYDVLVHALVPLRDLDWHLTIAGSRERAPETARELDDLVSACGLSGRITLAGEVTDRELEAAYRSAGAFVLSSHYEGYGMVLAEAMAHGLPIVTTTGGAAAATVPDAAALKVKPGDAQALGAALRRLLTDEDLRRKLAGASWRTGQTLPGWEDTAHKVAQVIRQVMHEAAPEHAR